MASAPHKKTMFTVVTTLFRSKLQYNSLQIPTNCSYRSEVVAERNKATSYQGRATDCPKVEVSVQHGQVALDNYLYEDRNQIHVNSYLNKESLESQSTFFNRENLCMLVEPRCSQCKCGRCPVPGSRYSHREEGELKMIKDNLKHNGRCWEMSYPFLFPRELLQGTRRSGEQVLFSTENSLRKGGWGAQYDACIQEMLDRGVVRKVSKEEMDSFE